MRTITTARVDPLRAANRGFTLLELLAAFTIFGLMASMVLVDLDHSTDNALNSIRARELRLLAEQRLGEIKIFQREYDDIFDNRDFDDYDEERWEDWKWDLDIRDVVVFGRSSDENAEYLFEPPDEEEEDAAAAPGAQPTGEQEGETQFLRELTFTVKAPPDEANGDQDSVTILLFLPLVIDAAAGTQQPNDPGGGGG